MSVQFDSNCNYVQQLNQDSSITYHSSQRMHTTPVARLDEEIIIDFHEVYANQDPVVW